MQIMLAVLMLGTFRFWDENEYEIWLPVFSENTEKFYSPGPSVSKPD